MVVKKTAPKKTIKNNIVVLQPLCTTMPKGPNAMWHKRATAHQSLIFPYAHTHTRRSRSVTLYNPRRRRWLTHTHARTLLQISSYNFRLLLSERFCCGSALSSTNLIDTTTQSVRPTDALLFFFFFGWDLSKYQRACLIVLNCVVGLLGWCHCCGWTLLLKRRREQTFP